MLREDDDAQSQISLNLSGYRGEMGLITKGGYNWTSRYPWIVEAARKLRPRRFVIDGEAIILGIDADFDALHSGRHNDEVQLRAFDILALDGDDLRGLPLSMRKTNLERLLARRPDGIFVAPFEQGEIGPDLFRAACRVGLEGLVSKRRDRPYQAGRSKHWIKKNRKHPAMSRVMLASSPSALHVGVGSWPATVDRASQPRDQRQQGRGQTR
jgi:bifunctional non-homologous end joining protein LigD